MDTKTTTKKAEVLNMEAPIYNAQGKKTGTVNLPASVFGVAWNASLMHQVVTSMEDNARTNIAHTKTRNEVRGGGKKPWQQKGTGRARHSSTRSPIWKGGGVAHGPRNDEDYSRVIPKKMRAKALMIALSRKFRDGEILFVETFGLETPKTATAKKAIMSLGKVAGFEKLSTKWKNAAIIALADPTPATEKSFRNMNQLSCVAVRNLNPVIVLKHKFLVIENPEAAVAIVESRNGTLVAAQTK